MKRYRYGSAGLAEWREVIAEAASEPLAGEFFEEYFTQPGLPLMPPTVIPLDVGIDGQPSRTTLILINQTQTFPVVHNDRLVVLDPDVRTHTVIVYEVSSVYVVFFLITLMLA
ncbi:unnamed protein product [Gongylonema pulchrum]|uniref:Amine oxidase n=1 Tax=Gongylonema pulchrum TaxID=637853 RepID=A0A183EVN3_9BILA|nr:unnamed protein product [Gongylonema pulchrum]